MSYQSLYIYNETRIITHLRQNKIKIRVRGYRSLGAILELIEVRLGQKQRDCWLSIVKQQLLNCSRCLLFREGWLEVILQVSRNSASL